MTRNRKTFDLGATERGSTLKLPNELASRRSAVFGISGSGKSNTATVCIEALIGNGEQIVLIDPKGEGYGLKSSANGKSAGLDVIVFGEPHGDIETLDESHGDKLADFVVESGRSIVLSLQGFDTDESERRFVTRFFKRLYRRKAKQAKPTRTLVVLEEAHLFVPESSGRGHKGDTSQMVGAIQRIARQGRSAGLGLMIVDQRPQDVSKRIISQVELLICHQLVHKLDRAALNDWVRAYDRDGNGDVFLDSLAGLQPGEAWAWSPGWLQTFERVMVQRRSTYDSGATPDGRSASAPKVRSKVNLDQLRNQLAEVVQKAEQDDPVKLRRQIKELERKLKQAETVKPTAGIEPEQVKSLVKEAVSGRDEQWRQNVARPACERIASLGDMVRNLLQETSTASEGMAGINGTAQQAITRVMQSPAMSPATPLSRSRASPRQPAKPVPGRDGLSTIACKVLDSFAWWHLIGVESVSRVQAGLKAGYTNPDTSSFRKAVYELRDAGLLSDNTRRLTEAGQAAAASPPPPDDITDYHRLIIEPLDGIEQKAFGELVQLTHRAGDNTNRTTLAERLGYTNTDTSSYRKALYRLRNLGMVDLEHGGMIRVTSLVYPEALA